MVSKDILILFGATGDLVNKKILPALNNWYEEELPYRKIICLGRKIFTQEDYLNFIQRKGQFKVNNNFKKTIEYLSMEFELVDGYYSLKDLLEGYSGCRRNFYLAVKPQLFETITTNLSKAMIFCKGDKDHKIIFEKPFGEDFMSFRKIQNNLLILSNESQIFRIDHYLGKDMIRNILLLRFSNRLFEHAWNNEVISSIKIISFEKDGVEERIDYYDKSGAINDMVQSHMLQMLALIAMEKPYDFESESIRAKKLEIMNRFKIIENEVVVGQYKNYRDILPAFSDSTTETYVKVKLSIDLPIWENVDFIIETGKKMSSKKTQIEILFKENILSIDRFTEIKTKANELIIEIYPNEGVNFKFNSKAPGYDFDMDFVESEYCHACRITGNKPEAYTKLLMDVKTGDKTLFVGFEEIEIQWKISELIKKYSLDTELLMYEEGELG